MTPAQLRLLTALARVVLRMSFSPEALCEALDAVDAEQQGRRAPCPATALVHRGSATDSVATDALRSLRTPAA